MASFIEITFDDGTKLEGDIASIMLSSISKPIKEIKCNHPKYVASVKDASFYFLRKESIFVAVGAGIKDSMFHFAAFTGGDKCTGYMASATDIAMATFDLRGMSEKSLEKFIRQGAP